MSKETIFLKDFLSNVGNAIHSLNTICVGLSNVGSGLAQKPDDLVITWNPRDLERSAKDSRLFAVKSTYVFLAESTYQYIGSIKSAFFPAQPELQEFDNLTSSERIERILKCIPTPQKDETDLHLKNEYEYRIIFAKLMVHTRNRIVHTKSNKQLSVKESATLTNNSELISKNHSGLLITQTLENFKRNNHTLKDISSHAANIIQKIRELDSCFIEKINDHNSLLKIIEDSRLKDEWDKISPIQDLELKSRKTTQFLKMNFSFLPQETLDEILSVLIKSYRSDRK